MIVIYVPMPILFKFESDFKGYKGDKGHIEGPGEQWERQPQGEGQGVVHFSNIQLICMFNVHMLILEWESEFRG